MKVGDKVRFYGYAMGPDELSSWEESDSNIIDVKQHDGIIIAVDDLKPDPSRVYVLWTNGFCSWMAADSLGAVDEGR